MEKKCPKKKVNIVKKIWWSVHKEDHEMCERLQEGRKSHLPLPKEASYHLIGKKVYKPSKNL